ncbi:MAG: SpoIIE family protein phosphatase [Treponema sp.]|jgi:sigma-B regulation protein RsbU (phosphoserine phosphatase)|nr:SpoIIE family protein phosphatase [Treponema sp.]
MNSIQTKIIVIVLVFLSLTGSVLAIYSTRVTANYKRLRIENVESLIKLETEKVNKIIEEVEHGAIFYAAGGKFCYEVQLPNIGEKLVIEYLNDLPSVSGGGFWYEPYALSGGKLHAGYYALRDRATGTIRLDNSFYMEEYDYHDKMWYREIKNNATQPHQVVWTRPYVDDSGLFSLMATAGAGVFDNNGLLIAISTSDWEINEFVKELMTFRPTENSFVILCDPGKDYIISSTYAGSFTGDSLESISWDINADSFILNNMIYLRFGGYMGNGWLLSVQIPENEIFAEINKSNSRFSTIITLAYVAMFFFAYMSVSMFINNPIKQLITEVSHLAIGNLDTRIKISSKDEIGQLADAYNNMKDELKKSIEKNVHERAEIERMNAELNVANDIQASMLPVVLPPFSSRKEFDLYASMVPARHIGGDFYDFYFINKDSLAVVIADVSGKGIPAALFMVVTKTLIKNCSSCRGPKEVFETVNKKLLENNDAQMFVTAFMGIYNIPTGKFVYVNAGHNPPLLKKRGGDFEFLKTTPCFVLAWMENAKYIETEITLEDGDILYLYTDGVTEAMNNQKEMFSEERLIAAVNKNKGASCRKLLYAMKKEVDVFCGGAEQADDITMLALKIGETEEPETLEQETGDDASNLMKELRLEAKPENLRAVIGFVNKEIEKCGYPEDILHQIDIAVEEIFMNIANYAYSPKNGEAAIFISTTEKTVIRFEDTGKPYNPLEHTGPDLEKPPVSREIGGLGILLVKKIMDTVEYSRQNGKNTFVMTKNHHF